MGWTLDHTHQTQNYNHRLLYTMDCSLGYDEFLGAVHSKFPDTSPSGTKSHFEEKGLTRDRFNELKGIQGNCSNLVQCNDPNSEFNDGNDSCINMDCYCLCKSGYEPNSSGKCIQSSSSNSSTNNFWTPKKVMVGVGIGIGVIVMFSLMSGGEKDVLEESV